MASFAKNQGLATTVDPLETAMADMQAKSDALVLTEAPVTRLLVDALRQYDANGQPLTEPTVPLGSIALGNGASTGTPEELRRAGQLAVGGT